jgi:hypothetical protein
LIRFPASGPDNRIPVAEKPLPAQGFFGEIVSGIPKGSTGNGMIRFPVDPAFEPLSASRKDLFPIKDFSPTPLPGARRDQPEPA